MENIKESLLGGKRESLRLIRDWNLLPNESGLFTPIPLTMPRMSSKEFEKTKRKYATEIQVDGDVRPGTASLLLVSEAMARELVNSHGSLLIKRKTFSDPAMW